MKVVFMGTPDFAVPVLEGLIENYDVVGVVSQPDKEVGRKRILTPTDVKVVALEHGIKVFQPVKIREDYQDILDLEPDIIVTCAYGQIIPKAILDYPRLGCINVHGSLLPKLRGGAPIHHAIIDGESETGITIMYMDAKMDSGDIIYQKKIKIEDEDTVETLWDKMSLLGRDTLLEVMPSIINGTNERIKQDEDKVTFGYNIRREEEHLDFNKTSREVFNHIRGLSPIPSAYSLLDDIEMKIYSSIIYDKKYNGECGEIVDVCKEGIVVKTSDGSLCITSIKPFGKKRMDTYSYVNGVGRNNLLGKVFK